MINTWFMLLRRVPDFVYVAVAIAVMGFAASCFVGSPIWLSAAYLPVVLYTGAVSTSPSFLSWLIAWRNVIAFVTFLALVGIGVPHALYSTSQLATGPAQGAQLYAAYVVIAIIAAVFLRQISGELAFAALFGKKRLALNILTIAAWTVSIILYPWNQHVVARGWYVGGFAVGIIALTVSRLSFARNAAAYRRVEALGDVWPPGMQATAAEWEALKLFARHRFRDLRKKLDAWKDSDRFTNCLALLSAVLFRHEGEYEKSLREVQEQNADAKNNAVEIDHLLLLEAVNLKDLGNDQDAQRRLDQLLCSEVGAACPLVHSTKALWAAEQQLANGNDPTPGTEPLSEARQALHFRREMMKKRLEQNCAQSGSLDDLLRGFVELGMPVTAASIVDVLACCHLAAGYPEEALPMFERCIEMDPDYSGAYLHLGDYFLHRGRFGGGGGPNASDVWHAEACYRLTSRLQRNKRSRISRLARERLGALQQEEVARRHRQAKR